MNFKKYQKYIILAGIASVFLMTTGVANAQVIDNIALSAISTVISWLLYTVGFVASWGVTIGGTLVNWSLNLNSHILTDNLVQTGWIVSRDIANLGFVFAIILIAFATILQMQNYAMKQVLWRLIAAALIVNFSLVIAGVFIDFSGILTDFFLSRATNGNISNSGETLVNAIGVHRVFQQTQNEKTIKEKIPSISKDLNNFVNFIASLAFAVFFTIATATALFSFAAMFFIRYLSLITLLILAPLAWLMWVWPDTKGQWSKWWSEFFKWIWFGPAASFFFYLAISLALTFNKGGANFLPEGTSLATINDAGLLMQNIGKLIAQMVSVIGLMYYGLTVANSMGIAGANFGFAVAGKVKGAMLGVTGYGARKGVSGIDALSNKFTGKTVRENLQRATGALAGVPVFGGLAQEANKALLAGGKKTSAEYNSHYSSMDKEARFNAARSSALIDPDERAAVMSVIAGNGEIEEFKNEFKEIIGSDPNTGKATYGDWKSDKHEAQFESLGQTTVERGGAAAKAIISADPVFAKYTVKKLPEMSDDGYELMQNKAIAKAIGSATGEAIKNIKIDELIKPSNLANLRNHHLSAILERSTADIENFVRALEKELAVIKNTDTNLLTDEQRKYVILAQRINATPASWAGTQIDPELIAKHSKKTGDSPKKPLFDASGNLIP